MPFDFETEILTRNPALMNSEEMPRSEVSQLQKERGYWNVSSSYMWHLSDEKWQRQKGERD